MALYADMFRVVAQALVNVLAVAGAFLVGIGLGRLMLWGLCRLLLRKTAPNAVKKIAGFSGGIVLAILVAFYVFGDGTGWGIGTGQTATPGQGTEEKQGKATAVQADILGTPKARMEPPRPVEVPPAPKAEPKVIPNVPDLPASQTERVQILGGYDMFERYYQIEGQAERRNLSELKEHLKSRIGDAKAPLKGITILVFADSAASDGPVVTQLKRWARETGLGVHEPAMGAGSRPRP